VEGVKTRHRTPLLLLAALSTTLAACSSSEPTAPSSSNPTGTVLRSTSLPAASDITLAPGRTEETGFAEAYDRALRGASLPSDVKYVLPQLELFPTYVTQAGYWDVVAPIEETTITSIPSALSWAEGSLGGVARSWSLASSIRPEKYTLTITALMFKDPFASSKAVATMRATHDKADAAGVFSFVSGKETYTVGLSAPASVLMYVEIKGPDTSYQVEVSVETLSQFLEKSIQDFMATAPTEPSPPSGTSTTAPGTSSTAASTTKP
jgi:hypothetical protein